MGLRQVFTQTICSHNKLDIKVLSENKEDITVSSKCLKCGKQLNKCIVDKTSGIVEAIIW